MKKKRGREEIIVAHSTYRCRLTNVIFGISCCVKTQPKFLNRRYKYEHTYWCVNHKSYRMLNWVLTFMIKQYKCVSYNHSRIQFVKWLNSPDDKWLVLNCLENCRRFSTILGCCDRDQITAIYSATDSSAINTPRPVQDGRHYWGEIWNIEMHFFSIIFYILK